MGSNHVLLETERLVLRQFTEDDAGNLYDLDSDPEVMRFLSGGAPTPRAVIEADILPRFLHFEDRLPGFGFWAAIDKATGDFLGWFSLRPSDEVDPREASIGFRLRQAVWGQGYATEGARALIRLGFTRLGVQRVVATTYQDNLASRRVMEKAGMTLSRTFRLTAADLDRVDTYALSSHELWDGEDVEYSFQKADWEQQERNHMTKPVVAVTIGQAHYARMMSPAAWNALAAFADVVHHPGQEPAAKDDLLALLPGADGCLTSWGVACLDADVIAAAPRLQIMAHMGSSVARFVSDTLWQRGIRVTTAAPALARDVAVTTLGLMIVGLKRIWPLGQHVRTGGWRESPFWPSRELYGKTVGIVGASHVGRHVIELLRPFGVRILLYDPYVSEQEAGHLGVTKAGLDDLLRQADVVSLHAPAKPETHHLLNASRLALMKDDALLINTARGTLIDEAALIAELRRGRFFAFLDVTDPEPPAAGSPLRHLDNVVVTPHLAGCIEDCGQMGEMAVEELRRHFAGEPPLYEVTAAMLARIA